MGRACPVQLVSQHPEEAFDPALSLRASLAEAGDVDGPRADHLMRIFSVEGEWLSRRPHEVSGGQLMRVALVRALMASPRVLICDESTASLDLLSQEEIWRAVVDCQESEGFGLIVVSHDSSVGGSAWQLRKRGSKTDTSFAIRPQIKISQIGACIDRIVSV